LKYPDGHRAAVTLRVKRNGCSLYALPIVLPKVKTNEISLYNCLTDNGILATAHMYTTPIGPDCWTEATLHRRL
jgi:hypothetical protein